MAYAINIVIISGEVERIKQKFTKDGSLFTSFIVKQNSYVYGNDGMITEKNWMYFLIISFEVKNELNRMKEGDSVTVVGKLKQYKDKTGKVNISIIADKIEIHGNNEGNKGSVSWEKHLAP